MEKRVCSFHNVLAEAMDVALQLGNETNSGITMSTLFHRLTDHNYHDCISLKLKGTQWEKNRIILSNIVMVMSEGYCMGVTFSDTDGLESRHHCLFVRTDGGEIHLFQSSSEKYSLEDYLQVHNITSKKYHQFIEDFSISDISDSYDYCWSLSDDSKVSSLACDIYVSLAKFDSK